MRSVEWVRLTDDDNTNWGSTRIKINVPGGKTQWGDVPNKRPGTISIGMRGMWGVDRAIFDNVEEAGAHINKMLLEGKLTCSGVANNKGDVEEISSASWADLKIFYDKRIARPPDLSRQGATEWHNLKFKVSEIINMWPPIDNEETQQQSKESNPSGASMKDEIQKDMNLLAEEKIEAGIEVTRADLAYELSERDKYKHLDQSTIERLTHVTWK